MLKNPFTNNSLIKKYKSLINQINILEEDLKDILESVEEVQAPAQEPRFKIVD